MTGVKGVKHLINKYLHKQLKHLFLNPFVLKNILLVLPLLLLFFYYYFSLLN